MGKSGIQDIDRGWQRIKRETAALSRKAVKVGIQSDGGDVLDRAFFNEYGTSRIPARPFVSTAFDENRDDLHAMKSRLWDGLLMGRIGADQAAALLGEHHQNQVQEKITSIQTPPNAASTVEQKGSTNPLIDTGQMRQSVRYEVE